MDATAVPAAGTGSGRSNGRSGFGAGRLFLADSRLALGAANYARYKTLNRVFGVGREEANLLTFIVVVSAGPPMVTAAWKAVRKPIAMATGTNAGIAALALREVTGGIGGAGVRAVPNYQALLALAVAGGVAVPQLRRASRALRAAEHRARERRQSMYGGARSALRRDQAG